MGHVMNRLRWRQLERGAVMPAPDDACGEKGSAARMVLALFADETPEGSHALVQLAVNEIGSVAGELRWPCGLRQRA